MAIGRSLCTLLVLAPCLAAVAVAPSRRANARP